MSWTARVTDGDGCDVQGMNFFLLVNRQGKVRLAKWFTPRGATEKTKIAREVTQLVLTRRARQCNFIEWKGARGTVPQHGDT